jgi:hypothetical protein
MSAVRSLTGVNQTWCAPPISVAIDPIETSAAFQRARCNYVLTDVVREHFPLRNIVLHPTNAVQPV